MYTQCPDCSEAFRVTADVLRVAGGRVRCGGCGVAFNALNHLSEQRPEPAAKTGPAEALPELRPESGATALETAAELDDTGIRWPLDENEAAGAERDPGPNGRDTLLDAELSAELTTPRVDEVLSDTPTPLDEVLADSGQTTVDSAEVFAPDATATTPDSELRFDDHTGLPDDYGAGDDEAPPVTTEPNPAETSIDEDLVAVPEPVRDAPEPLSSLEVDLGLDDPDEWRDILAEVGPESADDASAEPPPDTDIAATDAVPIAVPTGDSDAMTLEEELDALEVDLDEAEDEQPQGDELVTQMEALSLELSGLQEELDLLSEQSAEPTIADELDALDIELEEGPEPAAAAEAVPEAVDSAADAEVEPPSTAEPDPTETSIDEDLVAAAFEAEARDPEPSAGPSASFQPPVVEAPTEHVVPAPTEEEETINRLIDQDLLALAIEDEDGMASTIALEKPTAAGNDDDSGEFSAFAGMLPDDASAVETIIMEGETARSGDALDEATEPEQSEDTPEIPAAVVAETVEPAARNWRMIGGAAALGVLLALQAVHFSRHTLATVPTIYGVLEPVYAAVGQPLSPAWDVAGWRFEATRGSTDEAGETLTIYSRIGNNSDAALPYPVISVALTDRFEETIGSRVLEPADYLSDDVDSGRLVPAGTTFNASIAIESPADEAMGFKLNVCYRQGGDRLRCAIEDFRD